MHISLDFFKQYRPDGPWLLVAVDPDGPKDQRLPAVTFNSTQLQHMSDWVERMNNPDKKGVKHNIYFSVNPTIETMNKKPKRTDINTVEYLHVDIDPRAGEDFKSEQERILKLFRDFRPLPTCLIFSGGGYQGFWQLDEPIMIGGSLALAEDAKRYNMQLEIMMGGDNCHNVDRIMRVPGTTNWPNEKKRAKGREPAESALIHFDDSLVYNIGQFTAAQAVQSGGSRHSGTLGHQPVVLPEISGNVRRLDNLDELPEDVKPWVKVLIVQGKDPDEPHRFASRSETLFCVVCELIRANVTPEVIFSIITDPDFAIAASVVELGSRAEAYALKQIKSGMEQAIAPELQEMNARHAVIGSMGGKCRVISTEWDHAFNRKRIVRQGFEDIRNRYMHKQVKVGKKKDVDQFMPKGHWWLAHPKREQYDTLVFVPGKTTPNAFNLWQGFSCEARPGDCQLFLNHMKHVLCNGVQEYYDYLCKWMAMSIQHPDMPAGIAVVLKGDQGTGKGVFAKHFGHLFGQHFLQITNSKHLTGSFNNHLRDCVCLFADEAFYAGDKKNESLLKGLITEENLLVEAKGVDAEFGRNYLHVIMASNSEWVVPVEMGDRRFFMLDVSLSHKEDREYFNAISNQMKNGGYEALLHFLMTYDTSGYNFEACPKTEALQDQKQLNMTPEESWWCDKLQEGRTLTHHEKWEQLVVKEDLFLDYVEFVKRPGANLYQSRCTKSRLTKFLTRFCPLGFPALRQLSIAPDINSPCMGLRFNARPYALEFPTLEECREAWEGLMGHVDWQDVDQSDIDAPTPF